MDARLESQSLSLSFNKLLACIQSSKGAGGFLPAPLEREVEVKLEMV